nr:glycosyltransferase [Pelagirhabdus alkalitolerans]
MVSIITVYYNREDHVIDSIMSLLSQTYESIEVIAIDDGSTDNTYENLLSIKDPRYSVISHKNMGFVKSVIKGVALAKGDYVAIHGSGDISYPRRIEKQKDVLMNNDKIGLVGCYVNNYNSIKEQSNVLKPVIPKELDLTQAIRQRNFFTHGEVMFRKSVYNQVGGYRDFFKYSQDRDLWMRMSLVTDFHIIPEVLYKRYMLSDGVSTSSEKIAMQKNFNEISKQCIDLRVKGEPDLIDKYGIYAPFFRRKSKSVSHELMKISLNDYVEYDLVMAKNIINLSMNEKRTLINSLLKFMIVMSIRNKLFYKTTSNIIRFLKQTKRSLNSNREED